MLMDLQNNIICRIPLCNNVVSWLVVWSANVINTFKLDDVRREAFERVTVKNLHRPIAKFGERVWWIPNGTQDPGLKAETSLREDIYLGERNTMSDSVIAVEEGVVCARTVRIIPAGERWNRDAVLGIKLSIGAIL